MLEQGWEGLKVEPEHEILSIIISYSMKNKTCEFLQENSHMILFGGAVWYYFNFSALFS